MFWRKGRWAAYTYADGRSKYVGIFDDEEEAARAYDDKAKQVFINPVLNFLPNGSPTPDRNSKYVESIEKNREASD